MILEVIRREYAQLTRSQQRLGEFFTARYRQAAFMTASEVASALELNEATVIRFAQRLGLSGYPALVRALREIVQQELQVAQADGEAADTARTLLAAELEHTRLMVQALALDAFDSAVTMLAQAEHVYVLGQGLSSPLAGLLCDLLRAVGCHADAWPAEPQALALALDEVGPSTAMVGISAGDECSELVGAALRIAREAGAGTVTLASERLSPCAQAAKVALIAPHSDEPLVPPVTAIVALMDVLVQLLAARHPDTVQARRNGVQATRLRIMDDALRQ
ncbi:MAG: MurR/RpiR family transcriptional regulator [Anaerolineae bacterium]|jgi:DNA-binding MurR/RpiR family transcriptional regulator|nr:MurR/RpiR family transcriptional regulator [Chloroflexota bacterium]